MKKILLLTLAILLSLTEKSFAEDSSTQDVVKTTNQDGSSRVYHTEESSSHISSGGFYIEPMLMLSQEDTTIKTSQLPLINEDTSGNSKGYGIGLRFGGHVSEIFLLGLDARYSKMQTDDTFYKKADSNVYNIAPMVGIQTPLFGIRLLASYVVAGENNPGVGLQGVDLKFKEAAGLRFGAGVYVAAISINLEYQDLTYNKTEIESIGSVAMNNSTSIDANSRGYTMSVSFPIEL